MVQASGPLVVQSDGTMLLEIHHPDAQNLRPQLAAFAQLQKSPEYFHEYEINTISLWNAAQSGWSSRKIIDLLEDHARYPVPKELIQMIDQSLDNFGRLELVRENDQLILQLNSKQNTSGQDSLLEDLRQRSVVADYFDHPHPDNEDAEKSKRYIIDPVARGALKVDLIRLGYPIADHAGFVDGTELDISIGSQDDQAAFALRDYQQEAVDAFFSDIGGGGGSGVVVLPCGAGKTIVGLGIMCQQKTKVLILTPNVTSLRQWRQEILTKTTVSEDQVAEYSGKEKNIGPVTIATYQIMSHRKTKTADLTHFALLAEHDWGLIIYDEVHLLPAPVFRFTAEIQARRRLGLTATLVREDGREDEVFTLIGPRIYELPWRDLEQDGYIAKVQCIEARIDLPKDLREEYGAADRRHQFRLASENPIKYEVLNKLIERHKDERIIIIGQYIKQLRQVALETGAPVITGQTAQPERDDLYSRFRNGSLPVLIVSKVANFAVDLPDASVALQISGTFGSRQEEAQRLGRILRPKSDGRSAYFYSLVTRDTLDQEFAQKRQRFLMEQGYHYDIEDIAAEVFP